MSCLAREGLKGDFFWKQEVDYLVFNPFPNGGYSLNKKKYYLPLEAHYFHYKMGGKSF